jgi:hypothetical protein
VCGILGCNAVYMAEMTTFRSNLLPLSLESKCKPSKKLADPGDNQSS